MDGRRILSFPVPPLTLPPGPSKTSARVQASPVTGRTGPGEGKARIVDGVVMMRELIELLRHDPEMIRVKELQEVADKLSRIVNKDPAWGWRYLRNVLHRKMEPSRKLVEAIMRLRAVMDGTPVEVARSERVEVQAVEQVRPGALILAGSRPCANPECLVEFVPRTPRQRFHSAGCREAFYRSRKGEKSVK